MHEILFLKPIFKEMIWGGDKMKESFGYDIPSDHTGEAWIASAHPQGNCVISEGTFKGETLAALWTQHRELFGCMEGDVFPLLVKIIDAKQDLSIQVHPDDAYAKSHENGALGKTECWYILDCKKDATIVLGHNAGTKKELRDMIEKNEWEQLIQTRPLKPGDFFQITPGTVHAIKGGTLLIETQQNSAITYRLYDYGRLSDGKPRELHIDKSIDVITCPYKENKVTRVPKKKEDYTKTELVSCEFYTVNKYEINGSLSLDQAHTFMIVNIINGTGTVDGHTVKKGDNFLLPCGYGVCHITGTLQLITSHI